MAEVKVLVKGKHLLKDQKLEIGATISLIKTQGVNIVVDPGHYSDQKKLISALSKQGLTLGVIKIVVLTHLHLDHTINAYLFKNAKIFLKLKGKNYPGQYHIFKSGMIVRHNIKDHIKLAKDVEFLLSPGHTEDHISLLVSTKAGQVVIAGDAIANKKLADLENKPLLYNNLKSYNNSRKKILKLADFIVPGHGDIFKVEK